MGKLVFVWIIGFLGIPKSDAKIVVGKIFFEKDTMEVMIKMTNFQRMQYKVKYFDSSGKKGVVRPEQAEEIRFEYRKENVRMISRTNSLESLGRPRRHRKIFLKLEIDGKLQLYTYFYSQSAPGVYDPSTGMTAMSDTYLVERYILQKSNGELKRLKTLTFRKDMISYLGDCPVVMQKIENRDFRENDLHSIVKYYNAYCETN